MKQKKSKDHTDYKTKFSSPAKSSGIRKRSNEQYLSKCPKSGENGEAPIVLEELSNRYTDNLIGKIPRCSRGFGSSKRRKVKEDYTIKSNPEVLYHNIFFLGLNIVFVLTGCRDNF